MTLTRKDQVIKALRAGGTVARRAGRPRLLQLLDASDCEIQAWQQAIHGACRAMKKKLPT